VVAAYAVIWFLILAYIVVLGARSARIGRQVEAISRMLDRRQGADESQSDSSEDRP
jgi:CcmD family protein